MNGLKMSPAALTVTAHVNRIILPIDVLTLMDHSPAILRVLLGTDSSQKEPCLTLTLMDERQDTIP